MLYEIVFQWLRDVARPARVQVLFQEGAESTLNFLQRVKNNTSLVTRKIVYDTLFKTCILYHDSDDQERVYMLFVKWMSNLPKMQLDRYVGNVGNLTDRTDFLNNELNFTSWIARILALDSQHKLRIAFIQSVQRLFTIYVKEEGQIDPPTWVPHKFTCNPDKSTLDVNNYLYIVETYGLGSSQHEMLMYSLSRNLLFSADDITQWNTWNRMFGRQMEPLVPRRPAVPAAAPGPGVVAPGPRAVRSGGGGGRSAKKTKS